MRENTDQKKLRIYTLFTQFCPPEITSFLIQSTLEAKFRDVHIRSPPVDKVYKGVTLTHFSLSLIRYVKPLNANHTK